jgi:hypothetical protein
VALYADEPLYGVEWAADGPKRWGQG